ncbi:hypothetical protein [Oceanobacillus jeddahense]|uniref:hypothetical protein n=1 Tax=Oceanobacillus jeddahense TaxID=1462527 RepID=UPI000595A6A3|nr:hypothetical protein [Oceanobacillus jeddahense]
MQEVNLFYDRHPIKIIGQVTGKTYAEGAEADCFRFLKDKHPGETIHKGAYLEPLQVIRVKEKPTDGNQ